MQIGLPLRVKVDDVPNRVFDEVIVRSTEHEPHRRILDSAARCAHHLVRLWAQKVVFGGVAGVIYEAQVDGLRLVYHLPEEIAQEDTRGQTLRRTGLVQQASLMPLPSCLQRNRRSEAQKPVSLSPSQLRPNYPENS